MEEMNGIGTAINALGNTIANLEHELYIERICKENAEKRATDLATENERLMKKLNAVDAYIAKEGEKWQSRS